MTVGTDSAISKEQRTDRFLRVAALVGGFTILLFSYMFILPMYFPVLVKDYITSRSITLRAYYACSDLELEADLKEQIASRYIGEIYDHVVDDLESKHQERRIKVIRLLMYADPVKSYGKLSAIFMNKEFADEERFWALLALQSLGVVTDQERIELFSEFSLYDKDWLASMVTECSDDKCTDITKNILRERVRLIKQDHIGYDKIAYLIPYYVSHMGFSVRETLRLYLLHGGAITDRTYAIDDYLKELMELDFSLILSLCEDESAEIRRLCQFFVIEKGDCVDPIIVDVVLNFLDCEDGDVSLAAASQLADHTCQDRRLGVYVLTHRIMELKIKRSGRRGVWLDEKFLWTRQLARTHFTEEEELLLIQWWKESGEDSILCGLIQSNVPDHQRLLLSKFNKSEAVRNLLNCRESVMDASEVVVIDYLNTCLLNEINGEDRGSSAQFLLLYAATFKGDYRDKAEALLLQLNSISRVRSKRFLGRDYVSLHVWYPEFGEEISHLFSYVAGIGRFGVPAIEALVKELSRNDTSRKLLKRWIWLIDNDMDSPAENILEFRKFLEASLQDPWPE